MVCDNCHGVALFDGKKVFYGGQHKLLSDICNISLARPSLPRPEKGPSKVQSQ